MEAFDVAAEMQRRRVEFLQDGHLEARDHLRTIIAARDLSPEAPIPTPLMCAIEAARKVVE